MAVSLLQTPHLPFDQAYGPNPVTLTGIPTDPITGVITADKYVLQIYRAGQLIADLRQTPNGVGNAIFDIQNTLQNFVAPSINSVEQTGYIGDTLLNSANETTDYQFYYGSETSGVVTFSAADFTRYLAFGGSKAYYEVPYSSIPFIPFISNPGCTVVDSQGQPFTDIQAYRLGASITDGKPAWLLDDMRVYDHYVTRNDMTTISYYNRNNSTGDPEAQGIDAFVFWQYANMYY